MKNYPLKYRASVIINSNNPWILGISNTVEPVSFQLLLSMNILWLSPCLKWRHHSTLFLPALLCTTSETLNHHYRRHLQVLTLWNPLLEDNWIMILQLSLRLHYLFFNRLRTNLIVLAPSFILKNITTLVTPPHVLPLPRPRLRQHLLLRLCLGRQSLRQTLLWHLTRVPSLD